VRGKGENRPETMVNKTLQFQVQTRVLAKKFPMIKFKKEEESNFEWKIFFVWKNISPCQIKL